MAEWKNDGTDLSLHVYCHVSGGIVLGSAARRDDLLYHHVRNVLEAFRYGDRTLVSAVPVLDRVRVHVHFRSNQSRYNCLEDWGPVQTHG